MDKRELIAKTINKERGYRYYTYETEYNDGVIEVYHYGTRILTFSLTRKLKNGEYVKLGRGWSLSDKDMIDICLRHIYDFTHKEYLLLSYNDVYYNSGNMREYFKAYYEIVDKNGYMCLAKKKPEDQYTLYNYPPYTTLKEQVKDMIENKKAELRLKLSEKLKDMLEYLKSFTKDKRITLDPWKGYILNLQGNRILITFSGDVIDLDKKERICVHPEGYYGWMELCDNPLDLMITKALGLIIRPQTLQEGIRTRITRIESDSLELLRQEYNKALEPLYKFLKELDKTKTHYYRERRRHYSRRGERKGYQTTLV